MIMTPKTASPAPIIGPRKWSPQTFYEPTDRGFEAKVARAPCLLGRNAPREGEHDGLID